MIYFPTELFLIVESWQIYSLPPIAEVRYQTDFFSEYPQQIRAGTDRSAVLYRRQPGYYAVHYNEPNNVAPGAILQLNDGAIAVYSGEPDNTTRLNSTQATIGPIYTLQPNGSLAVPTGMVFIRFAEKVDVESQREAIKQAGYEIAQTLSYAPHTAWLRAPSGKISDALKGVSKLEAIPDVENVEPQMLMARVLRQ